MISDEFYTQNTHQGAFKVLIWQYFLELNSPVLWATFINGKRYGKILPLLIFLLK